MKSFLRWLSEGSLTPDHDELHDLIIGKHVPITHRITSIHEYPGNMMIVKTNDETGNAEHTHTVRRIHNDLTVLHKARNGKIVRNK